MNEIVETQRLSAMDRRALKPCLLALGGFALAMLVPTTARAACSEDPAARPGVTANYANQSFAPGTPYAIANNGAPGCRGADGGLDDDGSPGLPGQGAGGIHSAGTNVTIAGASDGSNALTLLARGGRGGDGGDGGMPLFNYVTGGAGGAGGASAGIDLAFTGSMGVDSGGNYATSGIVADAIGGRGGEGGSTYPGSTFEKVGGIGGLGGLGGSIVVTGAGNLTVGSFGITAQADGGGGGGGGFVTTDLEINGLTGGQGGDGGDGGSVSIRWDSGLVWAGGNGWFATASGGAGGNGGGTGYYTNTNQGGDAGHGGDAGAATALLGGGGIRVSGVEQSLDGGMVVLAVGGSGGTGGTPGGGISQQGGKGGNGGDGGTASATVLGNIDMTSRGLAPSASVYVNANGGAGGVGGNADALEGSAGAGGKAGAGGSASLTVGNADLLGELKATGELASAALVQSIGGGGGNGGQAEFNAQGGRGSAGGNAGAVTADIVNGHLIANDAYGSALVAQSIGGSGGVGGNATGGGGILAIRIGGDGATGGDGGTVDLNLLRSSILGSLNALGNGGVLAQSIGGAGGAGGSATVVGDALFAMAVGGKGGSGGLGGKVNVTSAALIGSYGDHAAGIQAQSIGGGGGKGGAATIFGLGPVPSVSVAVGGNGGVGGVGGDVSIVNSGGVSTFGADAIGLKAQSIGGGGGSGGAAVARTLSLTVEPIPAVSISVAIGGSGGAGNSAGRASISNSGLSANIMTANHGSHALLAQSIGGGGGVGGDSTAASYSAGDQGDLTISVSVAVGGNGGDGGHAGEADVLNSGLLVTMGADAYGLAVQSIGGGGGFGGAGDATATAGTAKGSFGADVAVGGKGHAGGHGYLARGDNEGGITTGGDGSDGMFVQSVGGGGGAGGGGVGTASGDNLSISVGVGGSGGAGGDGGEATAVNGGAIVTRGTDAAGLFAQSIGGGGGKAGKAGATSGGNTEVDLVKSLVEALAGGLNLDVSSSEEYDIIFEIAGISEDMLSSIEEMEKILKQLKAGPPYKIGQVDNLSVGVAVGGNGGAAGEGGHTIAINNGEISTWGAQSDGMFVQSVGGGGGKGGAASSTGSSSDDASNQSAIAVGGSGGAAGDGGDVDAKNAAGAQIRTFGVLGFGIAAQSVGGGGGSGGMAGDVSGSLFSLSVGVGGSGGTQGHGGGVLVENDGRISTGGKHGIGILAQSIGGGGGLVRTMTTDQTFDPNDLVENPQGRVADIHGVSINIGGRNSPAGDGGAVQVNVSARIDTSGRTAHAIVAQSIGGGGGAAFGGQLVELPSGAEGGTGIGGAVGVRLTRGAVVSTIGNGSYAILAQSIGGGGGIAGDLASVEDGEIGILNGNIVRGTGDGGKVSVDLSGARVGTSGAFSPAIFAQSIGGGGGLLGLNDKLLFGSAGGDGAAGESITIHIVDSFIATTGPRSPAVMAQNDGVLSGTTILTIDATSSVKGGLNDSDTAPTMTGAIHILGGRSNSITNAGLISGVDGDHETIAIHVIGGYTEINNSGTIVGSVITSHPLNNFYNQQGGVVEAHERIELGAEGNFHNSGTLEVGGALRTGTTAMIGNLTQDDSGRLLFDVDFTGTSDQLTVDGHADIGGTVVVRPSRISNRTVTLLTAQQGVVLHPSGVATAGDFALYDLPVKVSGNSLQITPEARFVQQAESLGAGHRSVAGSLQALFESGASADEAFNRLAGVSSAASYQSALEQISGKALGSFGSFRFNSSRTFAASLFGGCGQTEPEEKSVDRCAWARALANTATQDAEADVLGYSADATALQMGGQLPLSDTLALIGSLAYESSKFRDDDARITGDAVVGGLGLLYTQERLELSAGIDLAYGWYKSRRTITLGGFDDDATARPEQSQMGAHVRAAYNLIDSGDAFVRPFVEGHAIHVSNKAFAEHSASPFRLAVDGQSDTAWIGVAGLELGTRVALSDRLALRPFASGAIELDQDRSWTTTARLAGQPQSDSFQQTTAGPGTLGRFSIGADLLGSNNIAFSVQYAPEFGKGYSSHSGTAKLTILF
ncbi:autotransporter outer membrane beta-barrel domain-containing protein [Sandaracinobacteroides hominis]|uniref:autotransporter outer membrane beta-barrel domain-containing protein n=1 Tax=Sandaracinobacteroides hominis TaxID=2780086 RepID=UPI0018F371CA|nr:autotransporter outer membrane beta-barrel domain-containing protein [Sandaracinobacteroides hominis]